MLTPTRLVHDDDGLNSGAWPMPQDSLVTPVELFFTRSHAAVPHIDPDTWRLEIDGLVDSPRSFSARELERTFSRRELTATLVCAGLRRAEFLALGPLPGELPWGPEAASTGTWGGYSLREVLDRAGVREGAKHVELTGLDRVERHGREFAFGGSIDLAKAMDGDVILATTLNDEPLPPANGFPLRAVVPGWIGARSVKWLGRVSVTERPSGNYFQRAAYRIQRTVDPSNPRDVSGGEALGEVPVNAVIVQPMDGSVVPAGRVEVTGWAMGSGGRPVASVEISVDAMDSWMPARISAPGTEWTWSYWKARVELGPGAHTVAVRATEEGGASQPGTVDATWNVKGYANNAWHRVTIRTA